MCKSNECPTKKCQPVDLTWNYKSEPLRHSEGWKGCSILYHYWKLYIIEVELDGEVTKKVILTNEGAGTSN